MIIPVKDNQAGIDTLLVAFQALAQLAWIPREIVIVDNNSRVPVEIDPEHRDAKVPVVLAACERPGPASARNTGVRISSGEWLLFMDSDCIPTDSYLDGYRAALDGSVAYSGSVRALGNDTLSRYYDSQGVLAPPTDPNGRPSYLVTANALVWRPAFEQVGGFNEGFPYAAGEDIDLALRLRQLGSISYARESVVCHSFDDGAIGFVGRFLRYGRGLRLLKELHKEYSFPRPFPAAEPSLFNRMAVLSHYALMVFGYWAESLRVPAELHRTDAVATHGPDSRRDIDTRQ